MVLGHSKNDVLTSRLHAPNMHKSISCLHGNRHAKLTVDTEIMCSQSLLNNKRISASVFIQRAPLWVVETRNNSVWTQQPQAHKHPTLKSILQPWTSPTHCDSGPDNSNLDLGCPGSQHLPQKLFLNPTTLIVDHSRATTFSLHASFGASYIPDSDLLPLGVSGLTLSTQIHNFWTRLNLNPQSHCFF